MTENNINSNLQASLKSLDTEEWLDLKFYRPVGYRWAMFFHRLGVKPNAVTIASIFLGVAAGVLFYFDDLLLNVIGMCFLVWANMYDSADGQLARLTNQKSELGRILDGVSGDLWFISIYVAICLRLTPCYGIWIWLLAAAAGACHSKQAAMADYYRNIHLFFLKGKSGSELDNSVQQREIYKSLKWGSRDWFRKLYLWFYVNYTSSQESLSPSFQQFFKLVRKQYGDNIPQALRDSFREGSLPLMKYTNMLSFNTRVIVLFLSLIFNHPWVYFVFELIVLNAMLVYMILTHEALCRKLGRKISAGTL
jgi:hypothetical protein